MDANANQCQGSQSYEEEGEEPEPDNIDKTRKGRFIIEEIVNVEETDPLFLKKSFQKSKFDFYHRVLYEENWNLKSNNETNVFVYDVSSQKFINTQKIFNMHNLNDFTFLMNYTDNFKQQETKNLELSKEIDKAMIIQEESETKNKNDEPLINLKRVDLESDCEKINNIVIYKRSVNTVDYSFEEEFKEKIKFPCISPINSPKNKRSAHFYGNLPYMSISGGPKKIKMIINSIDESFNLNNENDNNGQQTHTHTTAFFRTKRLYSDEAKHVSAKKLDLTNALYKKEVIKDSNTLSFTKHNLQFLSSAESNSGEVTENCRLVIENIVSITLLSVGSSINSINNLSVCQKCRETLKK